MNDTLDRVLIATKMRLTPLEAMALPVILEYCANVAGMTIGQFNKAVLTNEELCDYLADKCREVISHNEFDDLKGVTDED